MNNQEQEPRTVEEAESIVAIYESLMRLKSNSDFKIVFEKHLFTDEVIRLHSLLAHPEKAIIDSRDRIIGDLDAISNIKFSLSLIQRIGSVTSQQLDQFRDAQLEEEQFLEEEGA